MIIQVCIGSACHLKGSYKVIQTLKGLIEAERLEDLVTLKSSFCLGACSGAVSIQVDDLPVEPLHPDEVAHFFEDRVKGVTQREIHRV